MSVSAEELARQPAFNTDGIAMNTWAAEIPQDAKLGREVLIGYSKIPEEEVDQHVLNLREKAFKVYPYPCIGRLRFLELSIVSHPRYTAVLERLKTDASVAFLDMGCCFAQVLRKLAFDGVPTQQLYGTDKELEFLELGYSLFRDQARLPRDHFANGDALAPPGSTEEGGLERYCGKFQIVFAASFLHLFSWDDQVKAGCCIVRMLQPGASNCLVFGHQLGTTQPGNYERQMDFKGVRFAHNDRTFGELWEAIGKATSTKWHVEVQMNEFSTLRAPDGNDSGRINSLRRLVFSAQLLSWM